jgi:hypothetical protein
MTGRAAQTARHEAFNQLIEDIVHRQQFQKKWTETLDELQSIDPGWESWYDARPEQTTGAMLPLILERIKMIKSMPLEEPGETPYQTRASLGI